MRDSSDDRYILSLSFRSQQMTHHTRIEHYQGKWTTPTGPHTVHHTHTADNTLWIIRCGQHLMHHHTNTPLHPMHHHTRCTTTRRSSTQCTATSDAPPHQIHHHSMYHHPTHHHTICTNTPDAPLHLMCTPHPMHHHTRCTATQNAPQRI